jgi:hypothetical protein
VATPVAIVGAGPYCLLVGAHLQAYGASRWDFPSLGQLLSIEFERRLLPKGSRSRFAAAPTSNEECRAASLLKLD